MSKKKEKADVWMPVFIGDYLADTGRLTTEQHGAYFLLMMDYWRKGPPPDDPAVLAQITRLSPEAWARSSNAILAFFERRDGLIYHGRIDAELSVAAGYKTKKAAAGSIGARAKWGDTKEAENRATRSERLAAARRLATHSAAEWLALREACGCCVKCGSTDDVVKDHITPIYQGGSDGIENLQPLCRTCNAAKGPEAVDYRPDGWRDALAKRLANASQMPNPSPSPSPISPDGENKTIGACASAIADGHEGEGQDKEPPVDDLLAEQAELKRTKAVPIALPDWLPVDAWDGFVAMRKKIRRPLTDQAILLAFRKLDELRAGGNDPRAVLEQSTLNSWQGLFELRPGGRGAPQQNGTHSPKVAERLQASYDRTADIEQARINNAKVGIKHKEWEGDF